MTMFNPNRFRRTAGLAAVLACAITSTARTAQSQIRVSPNGVNVNAQGATTVFLAFGGLGGTYKPVEAFWCGTLLPAAPDIGQRCDPGTLFGRLPLRFDLSRTNAGVFTDIMSIPASVARRAYDAAVSGANSSFFYVRRFAGAPGQPDQYVSVTCRMAGGGARVPLAITDVRLAFADASPVLFVAAGAPPPQFSAALSYNGTGRLRGRWEVVRPGDQGPEQRDLLTEASVPAEERGTQRRFEELSRFNVFLPPLGRVTLPGPDPSRLPTAGEGTYLILLRIEASDDKEGDSDLGAAGAGNGIVHNGAVAGFPIPVLRYVVGERGDPLPVVPSETAVRLLLPHAGAHLDRSSSTPFSWAERLDATLYHLQVETLEGVVVLGAYVAQGTGAYRPPPWLFERSAGTTLRWRVVAIGANGRTVERTAWRTLIMGTSNDSRDSADLS